MLNKSIRIPEQIPKLKNGHRKKYSKALTVYTYNTCSFDSLFQIFAALYADYERVKMKFEAIENSDFCNMVERAFSSKNKKTSVLNELYVKRDSIMQKIYFDKIVATDKGLLSIDCNSNICYTVEHVLPEELFSYIRKKQCLICDEIIASKRVFVDINLESFAKENVAIKDLNDHIRNELISEEIISKCSKCSDMFQIETTFSDVIMIDLQLVLRKDNKKFRIDEAPQALELCGISFKILALIEFIRDDDCLLIEGEDEIGHYVSHMKRSNDLWEKYDDLSNKFENSNRYREMEVHTLFFIQNNI